MRLRTMLLTTSLALVALSLPPAGADAVPEGCPATTVPFSEGTATLRSDCTVSLEVYMTCAPPSHTTVSRDLPGGHHVTLSVCDGGVDPGRLVGPITTAAAPGCRPTSMESEGPFGTNRVDVAHNCRAAVTLNEGIICLGGSVERTEVDLLGNTVVVYGCGNPNQGGGLGDPIAASTASAAPGCQPTGTHAETVLGGVYVGIDEGCRPVVNGSGAEVLGPFCPSDVDGPGSLGVVFDDGCTPHPTAVVGNACLGGGGSTKVLYDDGYVHVSYTSCSNNLPDIKTASAVAPSCEKVPSPGSSVTVRDDCAVYLRFIECIWGGSYEPVVEAGPVRVYNYRCGPPYPPQAGAASASAAPCSAVPGAGGVTVSDDCLTVTNKPYDCVWDGHWYEVRAGPVTYREYRCGDGSSTSFVQGRDPDCGALGPVGVGGLNTVRVREDCTAEVGVMDGAYCVGGWGSTVERDVAGNTVRVLVCDGGLGQRLRDLVTLTGPSLAAGSQSTCSIEPCPQPEIPGCKPSDMDRGAVRVVRGEDCGHRVDVDVMDCVWGGSWKTYGAYPATVRVYTCDSPDPAGAAMADPFPTCITEPCGPVPPGPVAPCSTVAGSGSGSQGQVRYAYGIDAGCNVDATVRDCVWDQSWGTLFLGPATVTLRDCGPADS